MFTSELRLWKRGILTVEETYNKMMSSLCQLAIDRKLDAKEFSAYIELLLIWKDDPSNKLSMLEVFTLS